MNGDTPFARLGLPDDADADAVREARRRLAKQHHPDRGGDAGRMRAVNADAAAALRVIDARTEHPTTPDPPEEGSGQPPGPADGAEPTTGSSEPRWAGLAQDVPSFTVEALPVETFEALLLSAAALGELVDDDPPYRLEARLDPPVRCWCQLDVVPDAGGSTVSLSVAPLPGSRPPDVITVRDAWIRELNALDW